MTASNFRASLFTFGTEDTTVSALTRGLHNRLWRQSKLIAEHMPPGHSESYYRKQLAGTKSMSLVNFVRFLRITRWLGDRIFGGRGQGWVAEVLQLIADEFDLKVVPKEMPSAAKSLEEEQFEAHVATARALSLFDEKRKQGFDAEATLEVQAAVLTAQRELGDLVVPR